MSRCIFCGYCELACPFDAITLGNEFEISEYNRDDLIYTKDMLLAPPIKSVPVADRRPLRHADPLLQGRLVAVANFLVWVVWFVAAFACLAIALAVVIVPQPVLLGARADREPRARSPCSSCCSRREFVAAAQVLVYAGAVMVMFLFVIAYLGDRSAEAPWAGGPSWQIVGAVARRRRDPRRDRRRGRRSRPADSSRRRADDHARRSARPAAIGRLFLTDHLLAFEVTSIVLLVAAVGGVVLGIARARPRTEEATMHGPDVAWYLVARARSSS